jgi:hypothetical protein
MAQAQASDRKGVVTGTRRRLTKGGAAQISSRRRRAPLFHRLCSEAMKRLTEDQAVLEVKGVVAGSVAGDEALR